MTSMTFSAFILLFFIIDIGYTFEMIESHFPIRPMGSRHSFVSFIFETFLKRIEKRKELNFFNLKISYIFLNCFALEFPNFILLNIPQN